MSSPYGPPGGGTAGGAGTDGPNGATEPIFVIALLIVTAVVGARIIWLAAALARLLSGRGWPAGTFAKAGSFSWALISTGSQGHAWRHACHSAPAPDALFWILLTAVIAGLVYGAVRLLRVWRQRRLHRAALGAQWATDRHEQRIQVPDEPAQRPGRLIAGRSERTSRLLAGEDCISAVAFGPNGSGKTQGLINPNVLEWDGPCVVSTAKGPDLDAILAARKDRGPVWIVAPAGLPGRQTACWSPVPYAVDDDAADRMARWQVEASASADDKTAKPWAMKARALVGPLLIAAHLSGGGISSFYRWSLEGEDVRRDVRSILLEHGHDEMAETYESVWRLHPDGIGSVLFTASNIVDAYANPKVRQSAARSDFTAEEFLEKSGTICIVAPPSEAETFAPMNTAMIASILYAAEKNYEQTGKPLTPRLLLALDEAGNTFRYARMATLLTTARGMGIQLLTIWHDLAQLETMYGKETARTILSNSKLRLLLNGVGDLSTLQYFSQMLGNTQINRSSVTIGTDGRHTFATNPNKDELAPLHELQQLDKWHAVLQYDNLPPMHIEMRRAFDDPDLLALSNPEKAHT
ncbi:hypothetical protein GCM10029978_067960 [Actinoallomurus acanthiterrae]